MSYKKIPFLALIVLPALPPVLAEEGPDIQAILSSADSATRAVKAVSYEAEFFGEGDLAEKYPRIRGKLKAQQRRRSLVDQLLGRDRQKDYFQHYLRFSGGLSPPNSDVVEVFDVASDTRQVIRIDRGQRLFLRGHISTAEKLIDRGTAMFMIEYFHPTPFQDELQARQTRYEGTKTIGDVECDVIHVIYDKPGASNARWFFGRDDSLPRRVERIYNRPGLNGAQVLTISNLNVSPLITAADFRPECPGGFRKQSYLLPVGHKAPDWELKTPDGRTVSLRSLRGQVVVMDFWATWCEPCKKAMPDVQKLHEKFKGRPVKILGVNCWERDGDPVKCMKSMNLDYTLLLNANRVAEAYNVPGIPTFYVIDPSGRIAYATSGIVPERSQELSRMIEFALKR
ncbi:MAG: TlpA family protein disulfide reductase [Phycisphaerales bacterium]|nr:TlpA family protein disulfide reductase [Phycisphaerales bacterium]